MKRKIFSILFALVLVLTLSLIPAVPAAAATLTVDTSVPDIPPNYHTIQAAIDAANPYDTINVAAGTYTEYLHITTDGLTIEGAGIDQSIIDLDGLTPYWHYPSSGSYASKAGVLISGYLNPDQIVEDVTFRGFTVQNAGLNPPITATGTHTGPNNQLTTLTDNTKSWTPGALVGLWVHNYGDRDTDYKPARSYGLITGNTATTVTVSLSGGKENDWDTGDQYLIAYEHFYSSFWVHTPNYDGVRGLSIGNGKNILIQNCKITDSGYGGITVGLARLVSTHRYSEGVTIDNCISSDHPVVGIGVGKYYKGPTTITNNVCENNGQPHYSDPTREYMGHGISVSGRSSSMMLSGLIANNICADNGFEGIVVDKYTDGVTVEDNTVTGHNFDQDGAGIFMYHTNIPGLCKNHIIRNNTVTGNIRGICAYYASYCTIEGNIITTDSGAFAQGQAAIKIDGGNNITVSNNIISCDGVGIKVQKTWNNVDCYNNTFTGNTIIGAMFAGVFISHGAHDNTFTGNTITGTTLLTRWASQPYEETQGDGVFLWGYPGKEAGTGNVFHYNNIYGNADDGMENQVTTMVVDATYNWWGDCSGPKDTTGTNEVPPCTADPTTEINADGAGDEVSDNVDYCPWLCPEIEKVLVGSEPDLTPDTNGNGIDEVPIATAVTFTMDITVTNNTGVTLTNVLVHDRLGAELFLENATATIGTIDKWTRGKTAKWFIDWTIASLDPGQSATLTMVVETDINPGKGKNGLGHQEYSSPGVYDLNSGATIVSAEIDGVVFKFDIQTDQIQVEAMGEED